MRGPLTNGLFEGRECFRLLPTNSRPRKAPPLPVLAPHAGTKVTLRGAEGAAAVASVCVFSCRAQAASCCCRSFPAVHFRVLSLSWLREEDEKGQEGRERREGERERTCAHLEVNFGLGRPGQKGNASIRRREGGKNQPRAPRRREGGVKALLPPR